MIEEIIKIQKTREKINKNQKPKPQPKPKKIKTFEDYFQECIKNKKIPPDTPPYLRKALERAIREYHQGIEKEKSSLGYFANKYVIKGEPEITPFEYFKSKQIINIWMIMILIKHLHIFNISTQIIFMDGQCLNHFPQVGSNG